MFFYNDKRVLYVILGIMVISTIGRYLNNQSALMSLILTVPAVLIAITFHEAAHAFVADKLGDDTPRREGRLSLNPLAHLDPIGCVLLLFAGFGWGKPVNVNPRNYTTKMDMEKADALVSLAGPCMNFIIAIILTLVYCAIYKFAGIAFLSSQIGVIIMLLINVTISINIGLGVFNLIPLPPLDGSKVIIPLLSYNARRWFAEKEYIFYIVFLVIWITGLAGTIISPVINGIVSILFNIGRALFGL